MSLGNYGSAAQRRHLPPFWRKMLDCIPGSHTLCLTFAKQAMCVVLVQLTPSFPLCSVLHNQAAQMLVVSFHLVVAWFSAGHLFIVQPRCWAFFSSIQTCVHTDKPINLQKIPWYLHSIKQKLYLLPVVIHKLQLTSPASGLHFCIQFFLIKNI